MIKYILPLVNSIQMYRHVIRKFFYAIIFTHRSNTNRTKSQICKLRKETKTVALLERIQFPSLNLRKLDHAQRADIVVNE